MLVVTTEGIQGVVRRMISPNYRPIVSPPPFPNAIHARKHVELVGNAWTDSYSSKEGGYDPKACTLKTCKGDVSTDSIAAGAIYLEDNTYIDGNAVFGPGGDPAVAVVNMGGTIEGNGGVPTEEPATQNLPLSTIPPGCDKLGPLTIAGNSTRELDTGCYWYSSIS